MSIYGAHFLKRVQFEYDPSVCEPIEFDESGYLVLGSPSTEETIRRNHQTQIRIGAKVCLLSPDELKEKFPWLSTTDIAIGSWGFENEGWFDPYSMMTWFKKNAIHRNAQFYSGEVTRVRPLGKHDGYEVEILSQDSARNAAEIIKISSKFVINAAGCWAGEVGKRSGISNVPIVPRKRRVYVVHCKSNNVTKPNGVPMVFDPSGFWVRREGEASQGRFVCGMAVGPDPDMEGIPEELDGGEIEAQDFFEEYMWEKMAARIPDFEALRIQGGWQGFYDFCTLDENAIIGEHPIMKGYYFAAGFSGHGIQHCPAVGRAIAELVIDQRYSSVDLSRFVFERVLSNTPLREAVCY
uniref:FAD-dependent oxidoreductase domain-containing protein 1 n=1 Tax=Amorphochlora amoebiformis TaxID=1561963 RepID=A0A7S0DRA4_9EUKA